MLEAAEVICSHTAGKYLSDLEQDRLLLGGIIRELLLIGEAANAVSHITQSILFLFRGKKLLACAINI